MKKVIFGFLFLVLFLGCSKNDTEISNEFSIINNALAAVSVNFRGNTYRLTVGESKTIHDIPNGSFAYETAAELPAGVATLTKGTHLNGTLVFAGKTKYTLYFIGSLTGIDPAITYEVNATLSSSDPEETTAQLLNP